MDVKGESMRHLSAPEGIVPFLSFIEMNSDVYRWSDSNLY